MWEFSSLEVFFPLGNCKTQRCFKRVEQPPLKAMTEIQQTEEQEEPVVTREGRTHSSPSSAGSFSSLPSIISYLKKWGYSIFHASYSAKTPGSVEDIRETHRRRVDRHTAPEMEAKFVILGNIESASDAVESFRQKGMGPNYLISKGGQCIQLVQEKYMAWCYNFAFWKTDDIQESGFIPGVGKINELKSYAVSIDLEGDGTKEYTEDQYTALISLLSDIKKRWEPRGGLPPWKILSAGEVEQPPPCSPAPGESFNWSRLEDFGFPGFPMNATGAVEIETSWTKKTLTDRLTEWGYDFGDASHNRGLAYRVRAFRQRYVRKQPFDLTEFTDLDLSAVTELLRLRAAMQTPLVSH